MRCWYTRWQLSNALDRDGDVVLSRGHVGRCAACQAFGRQLLALHAGLARTVGAAPPPVLRPARSRWLLAGPLVAGGAAALALAIGAGAGGDPAPAPAPITQAEASEMIGHVRDLIAGVSQVFTRSPLQRELDDLVFDGQRGLDNVLATGGLR